MPYELKVEIKQDSSSLDAVISKMERLIKMRDDLKTEVTSTDPKDNKTLANQIAQYEELQKVLADTKKHYEDLIATKKSEKVEVDKSKAAIDKLVYSRTEEARYIAIVNRETSQNNKLNKDRADQIRNLGGAYEKLNREFQVNFKRSQDLLASGKALTAQDELFIKKTNEMDARLKSIDSQLGKSNRFVGDYKRGWSSLGNSINQVTREFPSFVYSAQTGFLALSNNIPILTDEISKLKTENIALAESGKPTKSIIGAIGGALFSFNTLISIGVTLLTFYGAELVEWGKKWFETKEKIDSAKEALLEYNKIVARGVQTAIDETVRVEQLIRQSVNLKLSYDDRKKAITELQQKYPEIFKNYKTEAEINKNIVEIGKQINANLRERADNESKLKGLQDARKETIGLLSREAALKIQISDLDAKIIKIENSRTANLKQSELLDLLKIQDGAQKELLIIGDKLNTQKQIEAKLITELGDIAEITDEKQKKGAKQKIENAEEYTVRIGEMILRLRELKGVIDIIKENDPIDEAKVVSDFDKMNSELIRIRDSRRKYQKTAQDEDIQLSLLEQEQKIKDEKYYFVNSLRNNAEYYDIKQKEVDLNYNFELETLKKTIKNENEFNDARIALDKKYAIEKEKIEKQEIERRDKLIFEERKRLVEQSDFAINELEKQLAKKNDKKEESNQKDIDNAERSLSVQQARAEQGLANTLEFEQLKGAKLQIEKEKQAKKEQKQAKILSWYNLLSGYAKSEPDASQALIRTGKDIAVSEAITLAFAKKGGMVEDIAESTTITNGNLTKSHGKGNDRFIVAEPNEGILTANQIHNLGGASGFYNLQELLNNPYRDDIQKSNPVSFISTPIYHDDLLLKEFQELKKVMINKPVHQTHIDEVGNVITKTIEQGMTHVVKYISDKPAFRR